MHHRYTLSVADPSSDIDKKYSEVNLTHSALRTDERHGLMTIAFNSIMDLFDIDIEPVDRFIERQGIVKVIEPDLIAYSDNVNQPHVFFQNKLTHGLSDYQPNEYLARLPDNRPAAYFCTAPQSAFHKVIKTTRQRARQVYALDTIIIDPDFIDDRIIGSQKSMIFITWETFIEFMYEGAVGLFYNCDEAYLLARKFEERYLKLTA